MREILKVILLIATSLGIILNSLQEVSAEEREYQYTRYTINAKLDTRKHTTSGTQRVEYFNNVSVSLKEVYFILIANMGNVREEGVNAEDLKTDLGGELTFNFGLPLGLKIGLKVGYAYPIWHGKPLEDENGRTYTDFEFGL